jgi:hypothetical protein
MAPKAYVETSHIALLTEKARNAFPAVRPSKEVAIVASLHPAANAVPPAVSCTVAVPRDAKPLAAGLGRFPTILTAVMPPVSTPLEITIEPRGPVIKLELHWHRCLGKRSRTDCLCLLPRRSPRLAPQPLSGHSRTGPRIARCQPRSCHRRLPHVGNVRAGS